MNLTLHSGTKIDGVSGSQIMLIINKNQGFLKIAVPLLGHHLKIKINPQTKIVTIIQIHHPVLIKAANKVLQFLPHHHLHHQLPQARVPRQTQHLRADKRRRGGPEEVPGSALQKGSVREVLRGALRQDLQGP